MRGVLRLATCRSAASADARAGATQTFAGTLHSQTPARLTQAQAKKAAANDRKLVDPAAVAALPLADRIDKVKALWASLSKEERVAYLTVSIKELHQQAVEADEASSILCHGDLEPGACKPPHRAPHIPARLSESLTHVRASAAGARKHQRTLRQITVAARTCSSSVTPYIALARRAPQLHVAACRHRRCAAVSLGA